MRGRDDSAVVPMRGWQAWPAPPAPLRTVTLRFGQGTTPEIMGNCSAATRIDETLFVAADEGAEIYPMAVGGDGAEAKDGRLQLADLFALADGDAEADIEGLAADGAWLWIVGSHARTRRKPEKQPGERIDLDRLADLKAGRGRCLLGRLPLIRDAGGWRPVKRDGDRLAGILAQDEDGNALSRALSRDPLLRPFTRIPAKEGGIDIEGIAIAGSRVALGMRGPVIGGHAVLLETRIESAASGELRLCDDPVRRLLALEGLGIRDLKRCGEDLLILAGPTTGLSGPCALYRWRGWAGDPAHDPSTVRLHRPERILELPFGRGEDHPEGMALWPDEAGRPALLIVYDSPAAGRLDTAAGTLLADLFALPG